MSKKPSSILLVGLLSAYSLLTFDLYQPSLSYITTYFETTANLSQLTMSIYLLVFGIAHLVWGPLIDHFGRRRLLPGSLLLAAASSILCIYAPNITVLIIGRAIQGFVICCSSLIAHSTARDHEDPLKRAQVLSYISMIIAISPILAPVAGSIIFTYWSWQANFILMAGIATLLLIQSRTMLFESPYWIPPTHSFNLNAAWSEYKSIAKIPVLWCASMIMMLSFAAVMLSVVNSAYLIMDQLGYGAFSFGIIFMLNGVNIIFGNYVGIWLRKIFSMTTTIYLGNWFIILGGVAMFISISTYGFNLAALSFALVTNLGISISAPPTMSLVLTDFKDNTGTALAFINTIRLLGSSLLSILVGYWLMDNLYALPIGLIGIGLSALYFSWQFKKMLGEQEDLALISAN